MQKQTERSRSHLAVGAVTVSLAMAEKNRNTVAVDYYSRPSQFPFSSFTSLQDQMGEESLSHKIALILTALSKVLSNEKCAALRSLAVLPLLLSPERDEELVRLTERRVAAFAHDHVPDLLRTRPEPEAEARLALLEQRAANMSYDAAQKQVAAMNKVVSLVWDLISEARESWENEVGARAGVAQTSSVADTHALVAAVGMGRGLKQSSSGGPQNNNGVPGAGGMGNSVAGGRGGMGPGQQQQQMGQMSKAPSAIKTNIKSATQVHPYAR
ncbi:mediator of RNA polymerase II transcription subunit 8 isoform X1 [Hetaerina americana]|uniref:mediator of RNA polymerase II transcription subunit 8 isoform X1 n=1 Tax=Hetaerina americana TaxID=62018 RepID=UPI003A7F5722